MYRSFTTLLKNAAGQNEWVAAVYADIRGFSSVMSGDPAQTALYLRAVYGEILKDYFKGRKFFKPTGDGLLLVISFPPDEKSLARTTKAVVSDAMRLHREFPTLIDDKLVKFPYPKAIGIGAAVGSVSRLVSGKNDLTLDYTGRPLNVATRLMDLARPSGVVIESTLDFDAIDTSDRKALRADHVYLKGVAETDGVDVLYTAEPTRIPERYRVPLVADVRHDEEVYKFTRAQARTRGYFYLRLTKEPGDRTQFEVRVQHRRFRSGKATGTVTWFEPPWEYTRHDGEPYLSVDFEDIYKNLAAAKVPASEPVTLHIAFPVRPDDTQT